MGDTIVNYHLNQTNDNFKGVYKKINETYGLAEDARAAVLDNDASGSNPWQSMINGAYKAVRLVQTSFQLSMDMVAEIIGTFGIPAFVSKFIITAIIISVIFALIYLWFNRAGYF